LIKEAYVKIKWFEDSYPSDMNAERGRLKEEWEDYISRMETWEDYISRMETLEPYESEEEW
jgi:tRNA(Ile)-lysidine synthase TilS/MesJ